MAGLVVLRLIQGIRDLRLLRGIDDFAAFDGFREFDGLRDLNGAGGLHRFLVFYVGGVWVPRYNSYTERRFLG